MARARQLEAIPLGGLGEFGMNLMVYRYGSDCVVVDAGMMFPGEGHLGIDVVIPDLGFLEDCGRVHGLLVSHGHEDHIGAVPYVLARHDLPVLAPPHARGLIRARLTEHEGLGAARLRPLPADGERIELGPFSVETIAAAHSIPQSKMLVLRTPAGTVLHTADFKLDTAPPDGDGTDLARLERLGREGVLALFADSTNADRPGTTPSESVVARGFEPLVADWPARVFVTMFASHVQRLQQLALIAARHDRRVALVGSSLRLQADVAQDLGLLRFPPGTLVSPDEAMALPRRRALIVATGTQGEPTSALARISVGKHRSAAIDEGDLVIHAAREIPGNEKSIGRMFDHLLRRGAEIVTARDAPVHVSGHPSSDELRRLLDLVRPRHLVPIHGEYRQLRAHARLAVAAGLEPRHVVLAESGDVVELDQDRIEIVDRVTAGRLYIDAALDELDDDVIRDRRRSAGEGVVVAVVAVDRSGAAIGDYPEIVTRGFVPDAGGDEGVRSEARRVVLRSLAAATEDERRDETLLRARIQSDLRRFLRRRTQRQPLIIPVIVEM